MSDCRVFCIHIPALHKPYNYKQKCLIVKTFASTFLFSTHPTVINRKVWLIVASFASTFLFFTDPTVINRKVWLSYLSNTWKVQKNAIYWDKTQPAHFRSNPLCQAANQHLNKLNGEKQRKLRWKANPLIFFGWTMSFSCPVLVISAIKVHACLSGHWRRRHPWDRNRTTKQKTRPAFTEHYGGRWPSQRQRLRSFDSGRGSDVGNDAIVANDTSSGTFKQWTSLIIHWAN